MTQAGTPTRLQKTCLGWEQEEVLRCLLDNIDPAVAEDVDALIVFGGDGKVACDRASFPTSVHMLRRLMGNETLVVQSGRPITVMLSRVDAPRVN